MKLQPNRNTLKIEIGSTLDAKITLLENVFDIRRICDWLEEYCKELSELLINIFVGSKITGRYTILQIVNFVASPDNIDNSEIIQQERMQLYNALQ